MVIYDGRVWERSKFLLKECVKVKIMYAKSFLRLAIDQGAL